MMKNRLTWLCLLVALAVTACNHSGNNTPKNNNGQKVDEDIGLAKYYLSL